MCFQQIILRTKLCNNFSCGQQELTPELTTTRLSGWIKKVDGLALDIQVHILKEFR